MRIALVVVLALAVLSIAIVLAERRPGSLTRTWEREVDRALATQERGVAAMVTEADLAPFPPVVQRFLRRTGIVGKPRVRGFRLEFDATMRGGPDEPWMQATAVQYEFFHPVTRLFLMQASRAGVPFRVLHRYVGDSATMEVRVAGLFPVQRLSGPVMTRSETVTLLNDICLLAPAALLEVPVTWEASDERSARAVFTNAGHTVRATLWFDAAGDLANFTSDDRAMARGKAMIPLPFSTPVSRIGEYGGVRLVADGEARYNEGGREWAYGRFLLRAITWNPDRRW